MDKFKKIVKEYIPYILIIVIILLIKSYVFSPIIVNGDSMDSTLKDGDVMILNKYTYYTSDIKRFDIVVIKHEGRYIIKRVIGLPGDKVKIEDNILYINEKAYAEEYLDRNTSTEDFEISKIEDGYYFVLGDNREVSLDSRSIGLIKKSDIEGKATYTLFPFNRFGKKE
ncbi:MAG: signal peptidase I [Bacilli bacterium]|nr:signal peptidase I [Bacilli bacterium]